MIMEKAFDNIYRNKKILITGHTGFKGSWLSVWLNSMGAQVHGVSIDIPSTPSIFEVFDLQSLISHHLFDIRDYGKVKGLVAEIEPDFIFHLAAQPIVKKSYTDTLETFSTNVMGTANILESIRHVTHECSVVMITSDKCYENVEWTWGYRENDQLGGKDPYSASKACAEHIVYTYFHSFFKNHDKVKIASVRAGNVIGGGDWALNRIVPDAMRSWSQNEPLTIRSPNATRPWQHVLEPLSGYLNVGMDLYKKKIKSGESFNFGPNTDQNFSVLDLLNHLARKWHIEDPSKLINVEANSIHEAGLLKLNIDKALHSLGWKPVLNFDETVTYTAEWYYRFYRDQKNFSLKFMEGQIASYYQEAKNKKLPWAM